MRIEDSPLFEKYKDPGGVVSYILKKKVAPLQQGFYFVNNSLTDDSRWLWFYCSFPPAGDGSRLRFLACADIERSTVTLFPDAAFSDASPYVDSATGEVWYVFMDRVFRRSPDPAKPTELVATVSYPGPGIIKAATHITMDPAKTKLFLDLMLNGGRFACGTLDISSGRYDVWDDTHELTNHGQHNPRREGLALMAKDHYKNNVTGELHRIPTDPVTGVYERLWTVTSGGEVKNWPPRGNYATHEWWSADGEKIYYCNPEGIQRLNIDTGEHICVHECKPWHAHVNAAEDFYVYDEVGYDDYRKWYRGISSSVRFFDRQTGRDLPIITCNPNLGFTPDRQCNYHIDPHPRISDSERYIIHTTTVRGEIDVALTPVEGLR